MKKRIGLLVLAIACILFLVVPSLASAAEYKGVPELKKGDYVEYEVDQDSFLEAIQGEEEFEYDIEKLDISMKQTVTGEESIKIGGKSVDCYVIERVIHMETAASASAEGMTMTVDGLMDEATTAWITKDGFVTVKSEDKSTSWSSMELPGFGSMESEEESTDITTLTEVPDGWPETIKVGDEWEYEADYESEVTEKSREKDGETWGDWDTDEYSSNGTVSASFKAMSEEEIKVPAGKFQCIKVKSEEIYDEEWSDYDPWDDDWDDDWTWDDDDGTRSSGGTRQGSFMSDSELEYRYISEDGIPVMYEFIEDEGTSDETSIKIEAAEFKYAGESGGGDDAPGFGAAGLVAGGLAVVYFTRRRKK